MTEPRAYPHPHVNESWLSGLREDVLEPDLPIIDAHHHLWDRASGVYLLDQLKTDLGAGHNVVKTVFIQCGYAYRADGPEHLKPVGETEHVVAIAGNDPTICAGLVGYCDFRQTDTVDAVLEAHIAAGKGRFRGIRQSAGWDPAVIVTTSSIPPRGLLADPAFRAGLARLGKAGLSYECSLYFPQLAELAAVARAFPDLSILANHCAGFIGIGPYAEAPAETLQAYRKAVRDLASCPNVFVKLGGQAMTIRGFTWNDAVLPPSSDEMAAAWTPIVEICIDAFGPDRCMFESNFPVDKGMCSYVSVWNAFKRLATGYSASEKAALLHDTAARFYRL